MSYWIALRAIIYREFHRFIHQRSRFFSSLVRPLLWLLIFGAGFRAALGLSIIPPYQTYITYEEYIAPGLVGMIFLFNGMQSALALVYDREMGSMRLLLTSPMPRWWLLFSKLVASTIMCLLQAYTFLAIAWVFDIRMPNMGYILALPAMFLSAMMLGALSLLVSSTIRQLENFAGVMNFVIFPMFFLSTALYPVWRMQEASVLLAWLCEWNPFSHGVELVRFALYEQFNGMMLGLVLLEFVIFFVLAVIGYNPSRMLVNKRGKA